MNQRVIIESAVNPDKEAMLMTFLQANLPNVRGFAGCLQVAVYFNKDDKKMIFEEEWLSVEHHQRYISFIAENGVMNELMSFLDAPPEIKYFERLQL